MAENLKEVLARLKNTNSQNSNKEEVKEVKPVQTEEEMDLEEDLDEEEEESEEETKDVPSLVNKEPLTSPKTVLENEQLEKAKRVMENIEALNNNGVFRLELLTEFKILNSNIENLNTLLANLVKK